MKTKTLIITSIIILAAFLLYSNSRKDTTSNCDESLWNNVHNPSRLTVIDDCITISGFIRNITAERDGDYHVLVQLDDEYRGFVNAANWEKASGYLVAEPICQIKTEPVMKECKGFDKKIKIPSIGTHVEMTGTYVFDKNHGWMEIHPVTRIEAPFLYRLFSAFFTSKSQQPAQSDFDSDE